MIDPLPLAGDVIAAGTALAGLILVFMGSVASSFDAFERQAQNAIRAKHRLRIWLAFVGLVLALLSSLTAIAAKWLNMGCVAGVSVALLGFAFIWAVVCAALMAKDIG